MMTQMDDVAGLATPVRKAQEQKPEPMGRVARTSRKAMVAGRALTGLVVLFLAFDAAMKIVKLPVVVEGTVNLGYPEGAVPWIGLVLLACLVLHLVPRTSAFGAVLLTGYLGGAVATHVRIGDPLWSHALFPVYVGVLLWAGLWLRDARVRSLVSARTSRD